MVFSISNLLDEGEFYELTKENFEVCLLFCDYFDVDIGYLSNGGDSSEERKFHVRDLADNIHDLVFHDAEVLHDLKRMGPKFANACWEKSEMQDTVLRLMTYTGSCWALSEKNLKIIGDFFPVRELLEEHIKNYDVQKNKDEAPIEQQIRRYKNIVDVIDGRAKRLICHVEQAVCQQLSEMEREEKQAECERKYEEMKIYWAKRLIKFLEDLHRKKKGKK